MHHLLQIRNGNEVFEWLDLTPQEAYYKQAQFLLETPAMMERHIRPDAIAEELQRPNKKLRLDLRGGGGEGLRRQLDSIIPLLAEDERLEASAALIDTWCFAAPSPMSDGARMMFA